MTANLLLVIDHRETQVRMDGRALRVQRPERPPEHVPLGLIGLVVIHGSPLIGCEVWRELAERNIPAVLQPARGRGGSALIGAALGATIELRIAQHRAAADPQAALAIARRLVGAKIAAQAALCAALDPTGGRARTLTRLQQESSAKLAQAPDGSTLLGIEGAAAAAWYDWLAGWLTERKLGNWRFTGRNRRPPRDPVNALLSLGYTLLAGEVLRAVQEQGLDPALGYLHGVRPGRESLVLDLMEPLRASVDLTVLGLIQETLVPTHFTYSQRDGCRLNKTGRELFYRTWAMARGDWPDLQRDAPTGNAGEPPPATPEDADSTPASALIGETCDAEDQAGATAATPAPADPGSLPALCRRQVERLRGWLKPHLRQATETGDDHG